MLRGLRVIVTFAHIIQADGVVPPVGDDEVAVTVGAHAVAVVAELCTGDRAILEAPFGRQNLQGGAGSSVRTAAARSQLTFTTGFSAVVTGTVPMRRP